MSRRRTKRERRRRRCRIARELAIWALALILFLPFLLTLTFRRDT